MEGPQGRATLRRGTTRGSVMRMARFDPNEVYLQNLHILIVFLGGVALCMLVYSWKSPYWFMMGRRAYTTTPELRVLGLTHLLEGHEAMGAEWITSSKAPRTKYDLAARKRRVCSAELDAEYDELGGDGDKDCGLDCEDMKLLGSLRVPCDSNGLMMTPHKIPVPPAKRLQLRFDDSMHEDLDDVDMTLRWGCTKKPFWNTWWCPYGYKPCKERAHRCSSGNSKWEDPTCCVDDKDEEKRWKGLALFNAWKAPNYVHVFGWAQWQVSSLRETDSEASVEWCSVRDFRCQTVTEFHENGQCCFRWLSLAGCLMIFGLLLKVFSLKRKAVSGVALIFAAASAITLYATFSYHQRTADTLKTTTTPIDKWGRPHIHSVDKYDYKGRTIESMPKDDLTSPEWMYYHVNARVDYLTYDPNMPQGFTMLWGAYFGMAAGWLSLAACVVCIEMQCALLGCSPLAKVLSILAAVLLFPLVKFKDFVDYVLAAYPVLFVYPWQKIYPKAFTCGAWLPFPFDQMWDLGLCLPVHCIRAIWDYVSCQDICSPQEKEVLRQRGIHNDRLRSLLCSRRSYFAMMAGMGAMRFAISLTEVIDISDQLVLLRQASSRHGNYPTYRCDSVQGNCEVDKPDPLSLGFYVGDMLTRLFATIYEGSANVVTSKILVEWLGGFVAITCAAGALANWTNFKVSRKFCLIGWMFMMFTPVITSSFSDNHRVDWKEVDRQIVEVAAEVWEEIIYHVSKQPCSQVIDALEVAYEKGGPICGWIRLFRPFMPGSAIEACNWYDKHADEKYDKVRADTERVCKEVKEYTQDGVQARRDSEKWAGEFSPEIIDGFRLMLGLQAGINNKMKLMGTVMGMVPALMQGGLMVKNMIPRQTTPAILTTLPFAFTTLVWAQYQIYYQILPGKLFLVAILGMSFGPLVYYLFAKHYRIVQPMCDQQSVTLTFRIWWYAAICALILPYSMMLAYFVWFNDFKRDYFYDKTLGQMTVIQTISTIVGVLSAYAYSLQAGIDWFVDEIVTHHSTLMAPAVLTATTSQEEASSMQTLCGADLDLDSINEGTYVCGGLGDPVRMTPSPEGTWQEKAKIYAVSLAYKDFATLDLYAGHIKGDPRLPVVLARARRPWFRLVNHPPPAAFNSWDPIPGAADEEQATVEEPPSSAQEEAPAPVQEPPVAEPPVVEPPVEEPPVEEPPVEEPPHEGPPAVDTEGAHE